MRSPQGPKPHGSLEHSGGPRGEELGSSTGTPDSATAGGWPPGLQAQTGFPALIQTPPGSPPSRGIQPPSQLPLQPWGEVQEGAARLTGHCAENKKSPRTQTLLNPHRSFTLNQRPPTRRPGSSGELAVAAPPACRVQKPGACLGPELRPEPSSTLPAEAGHCPREEPEPHRTGPGLGTW